MREPFSPDMKGSMAAHSGEGQACETRFEVSHNKRVHSVLVPRSAGTFVCGLPGYDPDIIRYVARVCRHPKLKVRVLGLTPKTGLNISHT